MSPNTKPSKSPIISLAFRAGSEFISGIIVGLVFGLAIDHFFGTKPFGIIIMILFGAAAGFRNIFKLVTPDETKVKSTDQNEPKS